RSSWGACGLPSPAARASTWPGASWPDRRASLHERTAHVTDRAPERPAHGDAGLEEPGPPDRWRRRGDTERLPLAVDREYLRCVHRAWKRVFFLPQLTVLRSPRWGGGTTGRARA